jgi:micrococcal nuclease
MTDGFFQVIVVLVGIGLLIKLVQLLAYSGEEPSTQAKVVWVIDGDTYDVKLPSGKKVRIRILGIDTPELAHNGDPEQPYAQAAKSFAIRLIQGQMVQLSSNTDTVAYDHYQRRLAYVEVAGKDLGALLLEAGLATVFERYPVSRTAHYLNLQTHAKSSLRGMWAHSKPSVSPIASLTPSLASQASLQAKVVWVFSGDTFEVQLPCATKQRVRILGINCPQLARNGAPDQPYAQAAKSFAIRCIQGKTVRLVSNSERLNYDRYQRLLAYLEIEGQEYASLLLEAGLASVYQGNGLSKTAHYLSLQASAKASGIGMWG